MPDNKDNNPSSLTEVKEVVKETTVQENKESTEKKTVEPKDATAPTARPLRNKNMRDKGGMGGARRGGKGGPRRGRRGRAGGSFKPEFEQKIIGIRRVARVVAGGRRFSFSVTVVIGNRRGSVGVGVGKGTDTALAIEKAIKNAKKNMVKLPLTKEMSLHHEVKAKYNSARVYLAPAPGRGLVAGSSVRNVLDLAGVTDVSAKVISRSKNKINNARVTVKALLMLPGEIAEEKKTTV